MKPKIHYYRLHTGEYDSDGEICLLWIGGPAQRDKCGIWLTNPGGERVMCAQPGKIEELSRTEYRNHLSGSRPGK